MEVSPFISCSTEMKEEKSKPSNILCCRLFSNLGISRKKQWHCVRQGKKCYLFDVDRWSVVTAETFLGGGLGSGMWLWMKSVGPLMFIQWGIQISASAATTDHQINLNDWGNLEISCGKRANYNQVKLLGTSTVFNLLLLEVPFQGTHKCSLKE